MKNINIKVKYSSVIDLITSLIRLNMNERVKNKAAEYNIDLNNDILQWIEKTSDKLRDNEEIRNFFFDVDIKVPGGGLFLLASRFDFNITIPDFISYIKDINEKELIYYLIYYYYQGEDKLTLEVIDRMLKKKDLFFTIDKEFIGPHHAKWKIYEIFRRPDKIKRNLYKFLNYYYHNIYKELEIEVNTFMENYITNNEEIIRETADFVLEDYFSISRVVLSDYNNLIVLISYFGEIQASYFGENIIGFGFSFPELMKKLKGKGDNLVDLLPVFKVLSDETRIKILLQIADGPHYLSELAEENNVSPPTIDYHIKKFYNAGLIKLDRKKNRTYYKVNRDRLKKIIDVLRGQFDI